MLTRVDVLSENPFYLKIRDARPTDSVIVEKIEGLDPPAIDLFMGDYARDGGYYSGRRVSQRNVVFHLMLNPNFANGESVAGLREMLYRSFVDPRLGGDDVSLLLKDDTIADRYFSGYVEKFESDIFSQDTTVQISMLCPNPYILDYEQTIVPASGPNVIFEYPGSAETGVELEIQLTMNTPMLRVVLNDVVVMTLNHAFLSGDKVKFVTRRGERRITLVRESVEEAILYSLSGDSHWLELHDFNNEIRVVGDANQVVANINDIRFRSAWWGV